MYLQKKIITNIRYKFSLIFVVVIAVFAIVCSGIYIFNFSTQSLKNYQNSSYAILKGINNRFEDFLKQLELHASFIFYSDMADQTSKQMEDIRDRIEFVYEDNKNIESIFYYSTRKKRLIVKSEEGCSTYDNWEKIENTSWYRAGLLSGTEVYIQPKHRHVVMGDLTEIEAENKVFSFIKGYQDDSGEKFILCINIYEKYMREICENSLTQPTEELYCLNTNGEIIYSTDNELDLYDREEIYAFITTQNKTEGYFEYEGPKDKKQKQVVYVMAADQSNMIYKCVEKSVLNAELFQGLKMLFLLLFVATIIIIIIILHLINSLTKPINELKGYLDEFSQGNLNVKIESVREDEFKAICNSFNKMVYEINQLITEKYELELYNNEARLYSLLAQINPHFINNVLQSIGSIALEQGMKEVYKAITKLANMLRYSIKEDTVVTLEKEIANVSDYVYIQKFRFEDRLIVNIDVQIKNKEILIPKLTLQPLVENSIIHGLSKKKSTGKVDVHILENDINLLEINIKDNGCGMTSELIDEIEVGFNKNYEIERKHIGLCNVYQRLKHLYGDGFQMKIQSVVGEGTVIKLLIERE